MNRLNTNDDTNIFAIERGKDGNKIVAVFNLSTNEREVKLNSDKLVGEFTNLFDGTKVKLQKENSFKLKPWGYLVYYR